MKKTDYIRYLLDEYYNSTLSLSGEHELRNYFAGDYIDQELEKERDMFLALGDIQIPDELEERINETIDRLDKERKKCRISLYRWFIRAGAVAATVALVVTLALPSGKMSDEEILGSMTPEEVAAHTTRVLELMSRTINAGSESAGRATSVAIEVINNQSANI